MPKSRRKKSNETYQNVVAWEKSKGEYMINGVISFTPEFLEELLDAFEDNDERVVDDYDPNDVRIKVAFTLRESDYEGTDYYGNAYISEPKQTNSRAKKRRGRTDR